TQLRHIRRQYPRGYPPNPRSLRETQRLTTDRRLRITAAGIVAGSRYAAVALNDNLSPTHSLRRILSI
ncbi:MAG: hypothetical protein K2G75_03100, partial [Muribaculaceae bacterium]|nr:hypothetical protein [Muribaculaceae bacterium]